MNSLAKSSVLFCVVMQVLAMTSAARQSAFAQTSNGIIEYSGYSEKYVPVKKLVAENKSEQASLTCTKIFNPDGSASKCTEPLAYLEAALLDLNAGNADAAVENFAISESLFAAQESKTKIGGWAESATDWGMESILGKEDLHDYAGEGYERVLMLNFKSIAYLLSGKREAYNVTRRAINWQDVERKRFEKQIQKAEQKKAEEQQKGASKGFDFGALNISSSLAKQYALVEKKAANIPSAFVNPFSYYVAGMVQEFESLDDPSLRDNALISYKKALELNPESTVLKNAVDNVSALPKSGTRLVHVVAGDGFVPEKKIIQTRLQIKGTEVPVKLPIYVPDSSQVKRIQILTVGGKKLATLSTVADIEALCLRHQKDTAVMRDLRLLVAMIRASVEDAAFKGLGAIGQKFSDKRDQMTTPDTRAWMGLPATMQAARFYVPANLDTIKIVTYGLNGKQLASSIVTIDTSSHNFVYVRSLDKTIYASANKKMWL